MLKISHSSVEFPGFLHESCIILVPQVVCVCSVLILALTAPLPGLLVKSLSLHTWVGLGGLS